jgi:hypothetical protein
LHYLACFQKGLFGGNFEQKHLGPLGAKHNPSLQFCCENFLSTPAKHSHCNFWSKYLVLSSYWLPLLFLVMFPL